MPVPSRAFTEVLQEGGAGGDSPNLSVTRYDLLATARAVFLRSDGNVSAAVGVPGEAALQSYSDAARTRGYSQGPAWKATVFMKTFRCEPSKMFLQRIKRLNLHQGHLWRGDRCGVAEGCDGSVWPEAHPFCFLGCQLSFLWKEGVSLESTLCGSGGWGGQQEDLPFPKAPSSVVWNPSFGASFWGVKYHPLPFQTLAAHLRLKWSRSFFSGLLGGFSRGRCEGCSCHWS